MPSLSHSSLQLLQTCPKRYYFAKVEGVKRKGQTRGRRRGTAFSEALEAGGDPQVIVDFYTKLTHEAVEQSYVDDLLVEEAVLVELVQAHAAKFSDDEREIEFDLPIDETGWRNHGFIDGVSFTGEGVVLKEDKLLAMWGRGDEAGLPMNGQVLRYLGAAPLIWPGQKILGMQYRVTRWPGSYRRKDESARDFAARIAGVIRDKRTSNKLDELFALQPDGSPMWIDFAHSRERIGRYYDDLRLRVDEVQSRTEREDWPHAFGDACKAYGGCEFLPACMREPGFQELYETPQTKKENQ